MGSNKKIKLALARKYGKGCMFERANIEEQIDKLNKTQKKKIKTYKQFKNKVKLTQKKQTQEEKIISVHHMVHKNKGRENDIV